MSLVRALVVGGRYVMMFVVFSNEGNISSHCSDKEVTN